MSHADARVVSERLLTLPPPPFPRLRALLAGIEPGKPPIDMSIGEPRHDPPAFVRPILDAEFADWRRYPPDIGDDAWRDAVMGWLARRYDLPPRWLASETSVLPLSGTKEGLFLTVLATLPAKPGVSRPKAVIPNPFYQCYAAAVTAAGAEPIYAAATAANGFLPDLDRPEADWRDVSAMFLCSPTNPEGGVAGVDYWTRLLELAERHGFVVYADECYAEIYRDLPPSGVLAAAHAMGADMSRVFAFHSLSKRSSMAGLRSGFVVGGPGPIDATRRLRAVGGPAHPLPALRAAEALWRDEAHVETNRAAYAAKFTVADGLFTNLQDASTPKAGFFLWLDVDDGEAFAKRLWAEEGLRALPGGYLSRETAQGDPGRAFIRLALVDPVERVTEGLTRFVDALRRQRSS